MSLDGFQALNRYLLSLFGVKDIEGLKDLQRLENDASAGSHSAFLPELIPRIVDSDLQSNIATYDARLMVYEDDLRTRRADFRSFKYYQYLTLLLSEIVLDGLTRTPGTFIAKLNSYLNSEQASGRLDRQLGPFSANDLRSQAYYLATGSGKTLLMHVHYHQVLHYLRNSAHPNQLAPHGEFGRILLLAPNPGLALQHLAELRESGIQAELLSDFKPHLNSRIRSRDTVLVTDMFKLREERSKNPTGSDTIFYQDLGQRNFVLVDEGHKGTNSVDGSWRRIREWLSGDGLLLEYSATFSQVLTTAPLKRDVGRRIVSDYQYRYFYRDGYGKEFSATNVTPSSNPIEDEQATLMGGLLLYFQQLNTFGQRNFDEYNIERPLWVFVGNTVTTKKEDQLRLSEDSGTLSDVATVVRFVKSFLEDPEGSEDLAWRTLNETSLIGGVNPFRDQLNLLRSRGFSKEELYSQIAKEVFGGRGALEIRDLGEKAPGELSLGSTGSRAPFGLINIGDTSGFTSLISESLGIEVESNPLQASLFQAIDTPKSSINLLIGSRKFIEGWNSWRVSTMTLLYLGRGEGPQIIQLFGRGVRLKGKDFSLRRSAHKSSPDLELLQLETLHILGLKADYMSAFLDAINKEDARLEELEFPIDVATSLTLPAPTLGDVATFDKDFRAGTLKFENNAAYSPSVNLGPKVVQRHEDELVVVSTGSDKRLEPHHIALIDWPLLLRRLEAYAHASRLVHIHFSQDTLKRVLTLGHYSLIATDSQMKDIEFLQQAALHILKAYMEKLNRAKINEAQTAAMTVSDLDLSRIANNYVISFAENHPLKQNLENLRANLAQWRRAGGSPLPRLYISPGLLTAINQPMVHDNGLDESIHVSPPPLNNGEREFVERLTAYWSTHRSRHSGMSLYLLRNASRRGIGFHTKTGFYPDFVLWIERNSKWRAVFIEPHGMLLDEPIQENTKLKVFTELFPTLNSKSEFVDSKLELDGYIISQTNAPSVPGLEQLRQTWSNPNDWALLAREYRLLVPEDASKHVERILGG